MPRFKDNIVFPRCSLIRRPIFFLLLIMEAIGLAASLAGLMTLAEQIAKTIHTYAQGPKLLDDAVRSLRTEIDIFYRFIKSLVKSFNDPALSNAVREQNQPGHDLYNDLMRSATESQTTLQTLKTELAEVILPRRFMNPVNADLQYKRLTVLGRQVAIHRESMSLNLIHLSTYVQSLTQGCSHLDAPIWHLPKSISGYWLV